MKALRCRECGTPNDGTFHILCDECLFDDEEFFDKDE
jgi:NMD protein affecting ribosome stability and mRNA decay